MKDELIEELDDESLMELLYELENLNQQCDDIINEAGENNE